MVVAIGAAVVGAVVLCYWLATRPDAASQLRALAHKLNAAAARLSNDDLQLDNGLRDAFLDQIEEGIRLLNRRVPGEFAPLDQAVTDNTEAPDICGRLALISDALWDINDRMGRDLEDAG